MSKARRSIKKKGLGDEEDLFVGDYVDGEPIDGEDIGDEDDDLPEQRQVRKKLPSQSHIKSYIAILTSALGGIDYTSEQDPPPYKLGEEAFLCLQDIDKWFRSHDMKENSTEVAIACAESGIVQDLVTILCMWNDIIDDDEKNISGFSKRHDEKIAKMCLKLLVLLTWPVELKGGMYQNQLENFHTLRKNQLVYKKHILTYNGGAVLQAIIKTTLPVITKDKKDRERGDYVLIKQCVSFFRNLLQIEPAGISKLKIRANKQSSLTENLPKGITADDVGIGACIGAFDKNLVFTFFLTMCASIGNDRDFEPEILAPTFQEIVYLMLKTLKPTYIMFQSANTAADNGDKSSSGLGLSELLSKEKEMVNKFKKNSSSRHGRFGTLLSLQTPDMGRLTMSNTGNVLGVNNVLATFDAHKKWNKTRKFVYEPGEEVVFPQTAIGTNNRKAFHGFICDFIDGAFNPFIKACTKVLTQQLSESNFSGTDVIHYLMLIAWFLEAQRERYGTDLSEVDYGLVANAFSSETFILLSRTLVGLDAGDSTLQVDNEPLPLLGLSHASIILLKEIVLVATTLSVSTLEENRDLSIKLQNHVFASATGVYLEALQKIAKTAYKRSPDLINSVIDTIDAVLKQLDLYVKEDMKSYILREKTRKAAEAYNGESITIKEVDVNNVKEIESIAEKLSEERKKLGDGFMFSLIHPSIINAYVTYVKRFEEIPEKSLKKAIKFLHRVFFHNKKEILLYRLDFMLALHSMLSDEGLPKSSSNRKHVESFLTHYMRRFKKALDKTPTLYVEVLFPLSKGKDLDIFLETGELYNPAQKTGKAKLVDVVVEFKNPDELDLDRKVAILVGALIDDQQGDLVSWASGELERIVHAKLNQDAPHGPDENPEDPEIPVPKDIKIYDPSPMRMIKLVTEPRLRYLLKLAGVKLPTSTDDDCIFYAHADLDQLIAVNSSIKIYLITPVPVDDGMTANDYLYTRSLKSDFERRANDDYDDDELAGAGYSSDENDIAFNRNRSDDDDGEGVGYMDQELDRLEAVIEGGERNAEETSRGVAKKKGRAEKKRSERREGNEKSSKKKSKKSKFRRSRKNGGSGSRTEKEIEDYKSLEYVLDSDEEDDDAFFARERLLRDLLESNGGTLPPEQLKRMLLSSGLDTTAAESATAQKKRQLSAAEVPDDDDDVDADSGKRRSLEDASPNAKRRKAAVDEEEDDNVLDVTSDEESGLGSDTGSGSDTSSGSEDSDQVADGEDVVADASDADTAGLLTNETEVEEQHVLKATKKRVIITDSDEE